MPESPEPDPSSRTEPEGPQVTGGAPAGSDEVAHDAMSELVTAARSGDQAAFAQLVEATHRDTFTLAVRLTGNEEDARDVTQEAYLRAYRGLPRFRGTRSSPRGCTGSRRTARRPTWVAATATATIPLPESAELIDLRTDVDPELRSDAIDLRDRLLLALDVPAPEAARGRGAARRLRALPRRDRRGAGDQRDRRRRSGCTGRGTSCAPRCSPSSTRWPPVRCDEAIRDAGGPGRRARVVRRRRRPRTSSVACAARPSSPSTARCVVRRRVCGCATSIPGRTCSTTSWRRSMPPGRSVPGDRGWPATGRPTSPRRPPPLLAGAVLLASRTRRTRLEPDRLSTAVCWMAHGVQSV